MNFFFCILLLEYIISNIHSLDIYVSTKDGNDNNSGLSQSQALKTLNAAKYLIRDIKNKEDGITVNILPGIYHESLILTSKDSGYNIDKPIIWKSFTENKSDVTISGGKNISPSLFKSCDNPLRSNTNGLKCIDLKTINITASQIGLIQKTYGQWACANNKLSLYYNGIPQVLARYPNINNNGYFVFSEVEYCLNSGNTGFRWNSINNPPNIPKSNVIKYINESLPYLHGYWNYDWADYHVAMDTISETSNAGTYDIHSNDFATCKGLSCPSSKARFYWENMLSELDIKTEYYIDNNTNMLYWLPPDSNLNNDIVVSTNEYIIQLNSTTNHIFDKLTIGYSKISGIYGRDISNINITNCDIINHGNNGIDIIGTNINILNNIVKYIGCIGISIIGGNYTLLTPGNNKINYNNISRFSEWKRTYNPGILFGGVNNDYSFNNISFGPHQAIAGGGNMVYNKGGSVNNTFSNNIIYNTTYETSDSGAVYSCGQLDQAWINPGNIFENNLLYNIKTIVPLRSGQDPVINGIYMDDMMSGWIIKNNNFINIDVGVYIGGGRNLKIYNNYCNNTSKACVHLDNRGMTNEKSSCEYNNGNNWKGLQSVNYKNPPWSIQFPQLLQINQSNCCQPFMDDIENNQYCNGHMFDFSNSTAEQQWGVITKNNTKNCM